MLPNSVTLNPSNSMGLKIKGVEFDHFGILEPRRNRHHANDVTACE